MRVERVANKNMGGGALLDIGIYSLMAVITAFQDEEPEKLTVAGTLSDGNVDDSAFLTLKYSKNRVGNATCYARAQLHNEAVIVGDAGFIRFLEPFHCGETIEVQKFKDNGSNAQEALPLETHTFPHPKTDKFMNFANSQALSYEASAVRKAIMEGKTECEEWSHKVSTMVSGILTKARLEIGSRMDCDE